MPAAVPGAAAPTVTAGDDMQVPTPAMVAPDEVQAVAVPEPSVASTPAMDASASAAPAASMVAVTATKATIISREASTASSARPPQPRGHHASVSTSGSTDVSSTSPAPGVNP